VAYAEHEDEVLLNRYVDGEVGLWEKKQVERRLREEPILRSQLAEIVALTASLGIGLPSLARDKKTSWASSRAARAAAAATVVLAVGAGAWWWSASRPDGDANVQRVIAALATAMPGKEAEIEEIFGPSTAVDRRIDIYHSWQALDRRAIEVAVWSRAPYETDARARGELYDVLPDGPVQSFDRLIAAARQEWSARDLGPLSRLIQRLSNHPEAPTETLFVEILAWRETLDPAWLGERLPAMQAAFPTDSLVSAHVVRALSDPREIVRAEAALARAAIGRRDGIEQAKTLLGSTSPDIRFLAATTLARHGLRDDILELVRLVDDPKSDVKQLARKTLRTHEISFQTSGSE
jgi:HEAT repeats